MSSPGARALTNQQTSKSLAGFVPRPVFPHLDSIPRSYFLGHHRAGLEKMKSMISQIDLIIECRDYRTPLVSRNPMFEETLGEKPRLIVHTKRDLGDSGHRATQMRNEEIIRRWNSPSKVVFSDVKQRDTIGTVLRHIKEHAKEMDSLTGCRLMVVGMPNVGKSSLLNALRSVGLGLKKAARTGDQPGVTRKISTGVKIVEGKDGQPGVYLLDTPGVFIPYVPDAETMLKLALCGNVKENLIPPTTIADYLLFQLNRHNPSFYHEFLQKPTNDIYEFLNTFGSKRGGLLKGGAVDIDLAARLFIQRWRAGKMGTFILDEVTRDAPERRKGELEALGGSITQARKTANEERIAQMKQKYLDAG